MSNKKFNKVLLLVTAILLGIIFITPLLWMVYTSLLPDEEVLHGILSIKNLFSIKLSFQNYRDVFNRVPFFNTIGLTFLFTGTIATIGLFVNSACAYAFARLPIPGGTILFTLITALIIIPFETLAIPLFLMLGVKCNLMNNFAGLFLPYCAKAFNIFFLRQYFLLLPKDLEEAARIEDASWYRIYFSIALPLAKPAIITCVILDFITHWSEYLWPLIISNKSTFETAQIGLGHFYTLPPIQWGDIMAYSVMATIPMLLIFTLFQRHIVLTNATEGLKG